MGFSIIICTAAVSVILCVRTITLKQASHPTAHATASFLLYHDNSSACIVLSRTDVFVILNKARQGPGRHNVPNLHSSTQNAVPLSTAPLTIIDLFLSFFI